MAAFGRFTLNEESRVRLLEVTSFTFGAVDVAVKKEFGLDGAAFGVVNGVRVSLSQCRRDEANEAVRLASEDDGPALCVTQPPINGAGAGAVLMRLDPESIEALAEAVTKKKRTAADAELDPRDDSISYATYYKKAHKRGCIMDCDTRASEFPVVAVSTRVFQLPPTDDTDHEPPLQEFITDQITEVLAGIEGRDRFWNDTHASGLLDWDVMPDGTFLSREALDLSNVVGFIELKAGSEEITAPGILGQVAKPLARLLEAVPGRGIAMSLLANYTHVRVVRAFRREDGEIVIMFGPHETGADYGAAFTNFLLSDLNVVHGSATPSSLTGWRFECSLGAGSTGFVALFVSDDDSTTVAVKALYSVDAAVVEVAVQRAMHALVTDETALVCEVRDLNFGPGTFAMEPVGTAIAAMTRVQALQLARFLDRMHANGRLHRDLRIPNIMQTSAGRVLLLDFGGSLVLEAGTGMTAPFVSKGSLSLESDRVLRLEARGTNAISYTVADERETFAKVVIAFNSKAWAKALLTTRRNQRSRVDWASIVRFLSAWMAAHLERVRATTTCEAAVDVLFAVDGTFTPDFT